MSSIGSKIPKLNIGLRRDWCYIASFSPLFFYLYSLLLKEETTFLTKFNRYI